ncbi:type II toxin-antitoxin system RelE/ParE family toxin [Candidatus Kaiserbacteria bacterium]|nr:MAG: type II toxin-antitoxin system RelE/ParE family toxin [Candidatus Kaiserbacteria bacterium]
MHQIKLHKQVAKFVVGLPPKQQRQIAAALISLQENNLPQDAKKLQGYPYYRIDCGEYRIIYNWDDVMINVYVIGKRNDGDVYRKFQRKF